MLKICTFWPTFFLFPLYSSLPWQPLTVHKDFLCPYRCQHLLINLFVIAFLPNLMCYFVASICIALMISDFEHLFISLDFSYAKKNLFVSSAHFKIRFFYFFSIEFCFVLLWITKTLTRNGLQIFSPIL